LEVKPIFLLDEAEADFNDVMAYYRRIHHRVSADFHTEFEQSVRRVRKFPEMYQIQFADFRHAPLHRFPYSLYYRNLAADVEIVGLLDERADPDWIKEQLSARHRPE
jgi:plasmid stabilization system protein ParE